MSDTLNYDSICLLVGRLVIQHQTQIERIGQNLAQVQKLYNDVSEEVTKLRGDNARLKYELEQRNDSNGEGTTSQ